MSVPVTPQTVDENLLLVKSTIPDYMRTLIDETVRERLWLAMLMRYGRISYNHTGTRMVWNFLYKQATPTSQTRPTNIIFPDNVYNDNLDLGWRGSWVSESVHYDDLRLNGGAQKILDISGIKLNACASGMKTMLASQLYVDGEAAGNESCFHGLGTFQKFGGTVAAGDKIKVPSGTYAGKSIALGGLGGSWSSDLSTKPNAVLGKDWPYGSGTSDYDPLSTIGTNYTSTAWTGATGTWATTCERVMRWTKIAVVRRGGLEKDFVEPKKIEGTPKDSIDAVVGQPPLLNMLASELYEETLKYFSARQYQFVPLPAAVELGFPDVVMFDGMGISHDFDVPAATGNLLSMGAMELRSTYNDLIHAEDPMNKTEEQRVLYLMRVHGNLRFRPKCFAAYRAFA